MIVRDRLDRYEVASAAQLVHSIILFGIIFCLCGWWLWII